MSIFRKFRGSFKGHLEFNYATIIFSRIKMVDKTRTIINVNRCKCNGKNKRLTTLATTKCIIVPNKKEVIEG